MLTGRVQATGRDNGFVLVLVAMMMVVIVVMAGFATDLGAAYNDRRQDQSAADAAALAAVQDLGDNGLVVGQVRARMADTLGVAEAELDLDSCTLIDLPPGFAGIAGANCVGLDATGRRVAVRTPPAETLTAFGRIIGLDTIGHSAFAVAGLGGDGFGTLLPFGLFDVGNNYGCLRAGTGAIPQELQGFCRAQGNTGQNPPGNFGAIDLGAYTDPVLACKGNQAEAARLANNIATGSDHDLDLWDGLAGTVRPSTLQSSQTCPNHAPAMPNAVQLLTGNAIKRPAAAGLWHGGTFNDGSGPRLTRSMPGAPSYLGQASMAGVVVDDTPLWKFIDTSALGSLPESCDPSQFTGPYGKDDPSNPLPPPLRLYFDNNFTDPGVRVLALFDRCFTHFAGDVWAGFQGFDDDPLFPIAGGEAPSCPSGCAGGVPLFGRNENPASPLWDIQMTPRFGYAPILNEATNAYDGIVQFQPVFIHGIYASCTAGKNSVCQLEANPGLIGGSNPAATQNELAALTAIVLPDGALPGGLSNERAPFEFGVNVFARLLR